MNKNSGDELHNFITYHLSGETGKLKFQRERIFETSFDFIGWGIKSLIPFKIEEQGSERFLLLLRIVKESLRLFDKYVLNFEMIIYHLGKHCTLFTYTTEIDW